VDNPPAYTTTRAGSAVPIKFSLDGDQGLDVVQPGFPTSHPVACDTGSATGPVEAAATTGNSTLTYDPQADHYTYTWKTEKSWQGTCRQFTLELTDGSIHTALFEF
jgi:hypothetical protein